MNYMKFDVSLYCVFMLWIENETSSGTGACCLEFSVLPCPCSAWFLKSLSPKENYAESLH